MQLAYKEGTLCEAAYPEQNPQAQSSKVKVSVCLCTGGQDGESGFKVHIYMSSVLLYQPAYCTD